VDAGEDVFWIDAGTTVLRPLGPVLGQIRERGYFLVSQGWPVEAVIPSDYYALYGLSEEAIRDRLCVAAGIIGFRVGSPFYERVIVPTYEDCLLGRSLGFSAREVEPLNFGLQRTDAPLVRDCRTFRHDQTVLNIRLALELPDAHVNDLDRYAGWQSARDDPEQLVWNHRRRGGLRYLVRVPYVPSLVPAGATHGAYRAARWWLHTHRWLARPQTYTTKARAILRGLPGA
jgi:hypothetical protein